MEDSRNTNAGQQGDKYPYKDEDLGCWVYKALPPGMRKATLRDLYLGRFVMYAATLPPLEGLWIAEKLSRHSIYAARELCRIGEIYVN